MGKLQNPIIEAGANVNLTDGWGFSPLMTASEVGQEKIASILINAGAEVNFVAECKDCGNETALTLAVQFDRVEVVDLLLRSGADKWHQRFDGFTALDLAKQENHRQIIELLQAE